MEIVPASHMRIPDSPLLQLRLETNRAPGVPQTDLNLPAALKIQKGVIMINVADKPFTIVETSARRTKELRVPE